MEGIIRVLQAARMLTDNHLAPNEEYGLVVSSTLILILYVEAVRGQLRAKMGWGNSSLDPTAY